MNIVIGEINVEKILFNEKLMFESIMLVNILDVSFLKL